MNIANIPNLDLIRVAILTQKVNQKSGRKEWALVSKKDHSKILEWYGPQKPSQERVNKTERRVQMFKHLGSVSAMVRSAQAPVVESPPPLDFKATFKSPGWKALLSKRGLKSLGLRATQGSVSASVFYGTPSQALNPKEETPPTTLTLVFSAEIPVDAPQATLVFAKKIGLKPTPTIDAKKRRTFMQVVSIPLTLVSMHKEVLVKLWGTKLLKLMSLNNLLPMAKKTGLISTIRGLLSKLLKTKPSVGGPKPK